MIGASLDSVELKRPTKELCAINLRKVPRELRFKLKSLCADEGVTMEEGLMAMIESAIESQSIPLIGKS